MDIGSWLCDTCGEEIADAGDGYVIWRSELDGTGDRDFRIVHKARCDDRANYNNSMPLSHYLGVDGLASLLTFLSLGPLKVASEGEDHQRVTLDMTNFVDFVRRVQTPGYEQARAAYQDPEVQENHADNNELAPYMQATIGRLANGEKA